MNNSLNINTTTNAKRCGAPGHRRATIATPVLDFNTPDSAVDLDSSEPDAFIREIAGILAKKAGASPAMVFACQVMGTVLTTEVVDRMDGTQQHRIAEALALYAEYGELAWAFID